MNWRDNFKEGKEIILSTSSKENIPNANIVISLGFVRGNLLVADCQMKNTIKNLKENKQICAIGGYSRVKGKVKIFSSGKYFDICVKKSKGYAVNHAILIEIKEIFNLDNQKIIK
jgi:hypothetical protein